MVKLFVRNLSTSVDPATVGLVVAAYLQANPPVSSEPLLAAHIIDPNPHPVANTLPDGHFSTLLRNGMA